MDEMKEVVAEGVAEAEAVKDPGPMPEEARARMLEGLKQFESYLADQAAIMNTAIGVAAALLKKGGLDPERLTPVDVKFMPGAAIVLGVYDSALEGRRQVQMPVPARCLFAGPYWQEAYDEAAAEQEREAAEKKEAESKIIH